MFKTYRPVAIAAVMLCASAAGASAQVLSSAASAAPTAAVVDDTIGSSSYTVWDNLSLFAGLDGSKQPQDLGINANMGVRFSANMGFPVVRSQQLGVQVGAAVNLSDAAVHVLDQIDGTSRRTQGFVTVGLFQRVGRKTNWALGYDSLTQSYYDNFSLGQLRGSAGYDVSSSDEVGVWFTKGLHGDSGQIAGTAVHLDPISQVNAYLTHTWPTFARTTFWGGVASGHNNVVFVFDDNSRDERVFVYGAELDVPLSRRFALAGSANFLTPTATGTVDAFLGLTFYPGSNAQAKNRGAFVPRQTVANNPTFAANLRR